MFGASGLKVRGKVFSMAVGERLVVKLSKARADELIDSRQAEAFDPGHGRPMRQWVAILPSSSVDWLKLSKEALDYVSGSR